MISGISGSSVMAPAANALATVSKSTAPMGTGRRGMVMMSVLLGRLNESGVNGVVVGGAMEVVGLEEAIFDGLIHFIVPPFDDGLVREAVAQLDVSAIALEPGLDLRIFQTRIYLALVAEARQLLGD